MAWRTIRVQECDVCGSDAGVVSYRITKSGEISRNVALCVKHQPRVEELLAKVEEDRQAHRAPARARVTTMEEIAAKKAAAKKTTAKRSSRKPQ